MGTASVMRRTTARMWQARSDPAATTVNACTTNDVLNANCQCAGTTSPDSDGDGICNAQDNCPNAAGQIGSSCNDGNACTTNDVLNANCQCVGTTSPDSDGDGICERAGQLPERGGPDRIQLQRRQCVHDERCPECELPMRRHDQRRTAMGTASVMRRTTARTCPGQIGSSCNDGNAVHNERCAERELPMRRNDQSG
jgi:hypothetical protein